MGELDILIRINHYYRFVNPEIRRGKDGLIAISSVLGWYVCGATEPCKSLFSVKLSNASVQTAMCPNESSGREIEK